MIQYMFTVRDDKAEAYFQPFFVNNENLAIRAMKDCIGDDGHQFSKHTQDFSLYALGTYDDTTGKMELLDKPTHIANLVDLKGE